VRLIAHQLRLGFIGDYSACHCEPPKAAKQSQLSDKKIASSPLRGSSQ